MDSKSKDEDNDSVQESQSSKSSKEEPTDKEEKILKDEEVQQSEDDVVEEQQIDDDIYNKQASRLDMPSEMYAEQELSESLNDDVVDQDEQMIGDSDEQEEERQKKKQEQMQKQREQGGMVEYRPKRSKDKIGLYDYQNILFNRSLESNRIIYLPTGKGKTMVSIASMYYYLCKNGESKKIVFLANTIQLVKQQADSIKINLQRIMGDQQLSASLRKNNNRGRIKWTPDEIRHKVCCIHGEKTDDTAGLTRRKKIQAQLSSKRQMLELFKKSTIIVMIAQMFLNCLRRGYIKITDFCFMVLDECHHCHGDHPYAGIMRQFYFNPPKLDKNQQRRLQLREQKIQLPFIMGLSASPVMQQTCDKSKLVKQIEELCSNLKSKFTHYEIQKLKSDTLIEVIKVSEPEHRQVVPLLIGHFERFRDHKQSYLRIQSHFPQYFECAQKIIDFLKSKYEKYLDLQCEPQDIPDIQLLLFYDIKQCLLIKLRDVWLELGQYAFSLAFEDLYADLGNIIFKTEENKLILNHIKQIVKDYIIKYQQMFGKCQFEFFSAKVKKLLELLESKSSQANEMVVVFASKRRTVKYLQKIIQNYSETLPEEKKVNMKSGRVTGYSVRAASDYSKNETIFESDPSSNRFQSEAEHRFNSYLSDLSEDTTKRNMPREGEESESKNLANELRRIKSVKYGKLLLEVEQKYSTQISTIRKFRMKEFRILITTSVNEQGFDIPHCKIVISFDKPSSLKSYIQIKGRARQQYSKYYIFTSETEYEKMCSNKSYYDDIINATQQIAINKFSDKEEGGIKLDRPSIMQADYKRIIVASSGAIINTNYSLEILKMYCSSLRHPNKPKFYFVQTPGLAFRCLIYFPKTALVSKPWIIGQSKQSKALAVKSAAFEAVKYLYTQKYIKEDLRPKKEAEIEDQREIQKFEDLEETRKNQAYKKIFEEEVRIKCDDVGGRKFMRFFFKTIKSSQLDFPYLNPAFMQHLPKFETQRFPFQIYMMNFKNSRNMKEFRKDDQVQEVGVLMCFQSQYVQEAFSGYEYSFEENNEQKFNLKLQQENYLLNKAEYQRLKRAHQFLVASSQGSQPLHYSKLRQKKPYVSRWVSQLQKFNFKQIDTQRQYYPIIVILKKKNGKYTVDQNCLNSIQKHQKIFSAVYDFHNYSGKQILTHKFPINLQSQYNQLCSYIKMNNFDGSLLVQSLEKEHCFSKCIIAQKQLYDPEIQKSKQKRSTLASRNKKLTATFDHALQNFKEVVKIIFWGKYKKQKKKDIFQREGKLSFKEVQNSKLYMIHEFIIHPLSSALLFKCSLATEYLFKAVFQYCLAFSFRNRKLYQIFNEKLKLNQNKLEKPFSYKTSPNVLLQNGPALFEYLGSKTSSQYLRNIGKSFQNGTNFLTPVYQFSMSKINVSLDESSIIEKSQIIGDSMMNMSDLGLSALNNSINNSIFPRLDQLDGDQKKLLKPSDIKVTEILKVLTSRMYKFSKVDNYEQYEFIGDVVLKMLSTVQVFLDRPTGDESELHLARANLVCNANLHRKSIMKNIYRYVLTKKRDQLAPPYMYTKNNAIEDKFYEKTTFKVLNQNSQIEGYNYIPGKVHADIVEGLIGAFYLHSGNLQDCQALLYFLDILKKPSIKVNYNSCETDFDLPKIYLDFEDRINYHFKNKGHLIQAVTHSSFKSILTIVIDQSDIDDIVKSANKSFSTQQKLLSSDIKQVNKSIYTKIMPWETYYQRYEFLGDSILDLIVVEYLHEKFGTKDQGTLSALKQAGVSNKTLGMIAIRYGMHELILMDYPENDKVMKEFQLILNNYNHFLNNPEALIEAKVSSIKILGDVFESLVGAIFVDLDFDYVATKAVVMKIIKDFLIHYTDLETLKKTSTFKYQQYLSKNNYRDCQLKKDTGSEIDNGNFKYLLVDRSGAIIDECWQTTEKRAWDKIIEQFYNNTEKKNRLLVDST